jgi:phospholipase A-2-activating protein
MTQHLQGHQYQVTGVGITSTGEIVSSSLDKSVKIWSQGGECKATLEGHEGPINCMAVLPNNLTNTSNDDDTTVATGSGDKTIRLWSLSQGKCTKVIHGHEDTVRTLAVLPNVGIVSGSHDFTLKVWALSGELLTELVGHTRIIFTAAVSPDAALIASGGDDNTARVWKLDGTCVQVLEHPGCVWAVVFLPNGDIVTACADGVARVWTMNEERRASAEGLEAFNAALIAYKESSKPKEDANGSGGGTGGDGQPAGLPAGLKLSSSSALQSPGASDGQTIIVMEGLAGVAYAWNAAANEWERLGEVMPGPDGGSNEGGSIKKMLNGVEWDYIIDVDVADGAPPLKLAMNADENPYFVADRFIEQHDLPVTYKEQIVEFIMQNTTPASGAGGAGAGNYVDPYTGASAYVPPPPGATSGFATNATTTTANNAVTGGGVDPFTGSARSAVDHLPAKTFYLFEAPPPAEGLRKKMIEFNNVLNSDPMTAELAVGEAEMVEGGPLSSLLTAAAAGAGAPERVFDSTIVSSLLPQLLRWPAPQLFPCLDLARVIMLDPTGAATLAEIASVPSLTAPAGSLGKALAEACCASDPAVPASQQVALRCMTNCFAQPSLQTWARTHLHSFLALAAPCVTSATKGVRLGAATLLINVALAFTKLPGDELEGKSQVIALAAALLGACTTEDEEPRYRALIAVGTLLPEHSQIRSGAKQLGLLEMCSTLQGSGGKVGEVAKEVATLLRL